MSYHYYYFHSINQMDKMVFLWKKINEIPCIVLRIKHNIKIMY
jgi:hypothetical protein